MLVDRVAIWDWRYVTLNLEYSIVFVLLTYLHIGFERGSLAAANQWLCTCIVMTQSNASLYKVFELSFVCCNVILFSLFKSNLFTSSQ